MDKFKMAVPCLLGVEGLVAGELKNMEAENVTAQNGRVVFEGDEHILARANIGCRYGERVQIFLGCFGALSFEELFQQVKAIPWENWIGKKDKFPVKGRSLSSKLHSVPDCQSIIKKAVVERLKEKYGITWFEETENLYQIQFLILKDQVSIMIDSSGVGLHKRGYRANSTEAPIKETLAASMAYLARLREDGRLIDPCCGSGTILIEGALYALNIAPGIRRKFVSEHWKQIPAEIWNQERTRAMDAIRRTSTFSVMGYDIDDAAVDLTLANAKKAGVGSKIKAEKRDLREFDCGEEYGCVICNPPYGERLLDREQAEELYRTMGRVFLPQRGWSYSVITPDETFEECYGRCADRRRKLYNGMIRCQLYQYYKYGDGKQR